MWIKKIEIENFRNYQGTIEFDLDKKITILYGDNGFGKSSFFDAIEWGLTGAISRFEKNDNDQDFSTLDLINESVLLEEEAKCSITLYFGNYILHRYFTRKNAENKNVYVELKEISDEGKCITNINGKSNVDEAIKKIFLPDINETVFDIKQPFILSQDQVTDFVLKEKPKQRYKALANLMGLRKVVNYSDNTRLLIKELNRKSKDFQDDIMKTQAVIDSNTSISSINKDDLIKEANLIHLHLPNELKNYQQVVDDRRFSYNSQLINVEKKLELVSKFTQKENVSLEKLITENNDMKIRAKKIEKHIIFLHSSFEKLKIKTEKSKDIKKSEEELENYVHQKKEISMKKQKLRKELNECNVNEIDNKFSLDKKIEDTGKKTETNNYNLSYHQQYNELIQRKLKSSLEIVTFESKISQLYRKQIRKNKWREKISLWLANNTDHKAKTNLNELLKGVNEYLEMSEKSDICPVCSTNKEGNLKEIAKYNLIQVSKSLEKQNQFEKKAYNIKYRIEGDLKVLANEIKDTKLAIERHIQAENTNSELLKNIESNILFGINYMNIEKEVLIEENKYLKKQYDIFMGIKKYHVALEELTRKENIIIENINNLEYLVLNNKNLWKSKVQEILIEKRQKYLSEVQKLLVNIKLESDKQNLDINMLIEYGLDIDSIPLSEKFQLFTEKKNTLKENLLQINKLSESLSEFKRVQSLEKSIAIAKTKQEKSVKELGFIESKIQLLINFIKELNQEVGTEAIEFLNQENSTVQQLYRYLNPMVNSKHLKFVTENEELNIKVANTEMEMSKDSNAKYVLSSGQLNVLALSIFLAVNSGMKSQLDLVAIDDPIQNMDDVNQFTVCDVLSNLKRQLIFSTHDIDFVKLFVKKNEHLSGDIQVYILKQPIISSKESYGQLIFGEKS